jgi:ribosomal protein S18 acetylase RimI-like enzyme
MKKVYFLFFTLLLYPVNTHPIPLVARLATFQDMDALIALDETISKDYFIPLLLEHAEFNGKKEEVEKVLATEVESDKLWFVRCIGGEKNQRLFVAEYNNIITGFAVSHLQDDSIVVIDLLLIDQHHRSKGIGKKLIASSIEEFPQASFCMLIVLDNNKDARIAYEKMGFVLMNQKPFFFEEKYPEPRYLSYQRMVE